MKTILFLLTNSAGHIPQKLHETESVSLSSIKKCFEEASFEVIQLDFESFINNLPLHFNNIKGNYFVYASSQYPSYKESINDILLFIKNCGGKLIPDYEHFVAHENKFLQILEGNRLNLEMPKTTLINTTDNLQSLLSDLAYPQIAKQSSGYGSSTVQMVTSPEQASQFVKNHFIDTVPPRKNFLKRREELKRFEGKYPLQTGKVLFQEFLEGADHDWKVLVFGKKLFALKRFFRKNDFRASGSGNFDFNEKPDDRLLQFAYETSKKINTPYASLDIIETKKGYSLLEYQCVHFGLMTATHSIHHFEYCDGKGFELKQEKIDIDSVLADSLLSFIKDS